MRIKDTFIDGLYIIEGLKFEDERGDLIKPFSENFFSKELLNKININFKETWFTRSHKNVIRAMHLQIGEFACEKLVSVVKGSILDVILDIREDSRTYKRYYEIELTDCNNFALYIPKGCAHGYKVLEDNTITMYMATEINVPKDDVGFRWNSFGYNWNIDNPILSQKDLNLPIFLLC